MKSAEIQKKVCLLGDPAVGKTSLIRRYVVDIFDEKYIPTVGTKTTRKELKISAQGVDAYLTMIIWDIIGQKTYQNLQRMYYRGARGAVLVGDYTRPETLESLRAWCASLFDGVGEIPIVIIANKTDCCEREEGKEKILGSLAEEFNAEVYHGSAKTGENVEKSFEALGYLLVRN